MDIILIIFLILVLELITIIGRLIFGSAKRFYKLRKFPHIHHLYIGLIFLIFYNTILLQIGIALIVQDLLHHFIVLPLWVGESEFP